MVVALETGSGGALSPTRPHRRCHTAAAGLALASTGSLPPRTTHIGACQCLVCVLVEVLPRGPLGRLLSFRVIQASPHRSSHTRQGTPPSGTTLFLQKHRRQLRIGATHLHGALMIQAVRCSGLGCLRCSSNRWRLASLYPRTAAHSITAQARMCLGEREL
jgi:hypothetical protein